MPSDLNDYFKKNKKKENNNKNSNNQNPFNGFSKGVLTFFFIGALIVFIIILKPFIVINSGEVGIKIRTGKFQNIPLKAGLHFYIPIIEKIIPVNTRIRLITYSDKHIGSLGDNYGSGFSSNANFEGGLKRNPSIQVMDNRGLNVNIDIAVQYKIKAETAPKTIEIWGARWEEKIINSKVREVVRDIIGQYTAEQLPEKRNEIAKAIRDKIDFKIKSLKDQPVILSSVELRNIDLPLKIKNQIERVQIAKQDVTIAEQMKERAKQEAQRKVEIAKGEAERNRIEAQGEADKIRIEAEEQAKANVLISESLTSELLELEQIKTQLKFNEALRVNKDAQIFLTPGGAVPNIWVDAKSRQQRIIGQQ